MSRFPGATWRPVAYRGLATRTPRKAALLHTNGGGAQLYGWWQQTAARGSSIGAQYQVFADGRAEQYVDTDLVVFHAYGASRWAFAIETQDDGHPERPWTSAQLDTIAAILHFHGVPAQMLGGAGAGDGVGFHEQHREWNQNAHACPGHVREAQIPELLRRLHQTYAGGPSQPPDVKPNRPDEVTPITWSPNVRTLGLGDSGIDVAFLAAALNLEHERATGVHAPAFVDLESDGIGIFGPQLDAGIRALQQAKGLVVDGIAGPATWKALADAASQP